MVARIDKPADFRESSRDSNSSERRGLERARTLPNDPPPAPVDERVQSARRLPQTVTIKGGGRQYRGESLGEGFSNKPVRHVIVSDSNGRHVATAIFASSREFPKQVEG